LTVSGWVYEIGTGEVRIVEDGSRAFVPVAEAGPALVNDVQSKR